MNMKTGGRRRVVVDGPVRPVVVLGIHHLHGNGLSEHMYECAAVKVVSGGRMDGSSIDVGVADTIQEREGNRRMDRQDSKC